jgi:hypothetical protein
MQAWNENPKPFLWTAKIEDILIKIGRARTKLESIAPGSSLSPSRKSNLKNSFV